MQQISQAHNHGKYDNNGKGGYSLFDDDNNISYRYRYIFSITYTEMGQLNTYSPIYCNENKKVIDRTSSDILRHDCIPYYFSISTYIWNKDVWF